jgi:diketogulonate reductase-like aldo/keto reductase
MDGAAFTQVLEAIDTTAAVIILVWIINRGLGTLDKLISSIQDNMAELLQIIRDRLTRDDKQ